MSPSASSSSTSTAGTNPYAALVPPSNTSSAASTNQNTFLQLLVSELENQDPTNPTDSTQFVTQLAEFQQLSTTMSMATDVSAIQADTNQLVTAAGLTPGSSSQTNNSGTSATQP
jgi:flagellar basal-body rod modification protein FlgD